MKILIPIVLLVGMGCSTQRVMLRSSEEIEVIDSTGLSMKILSPFEEVRVNDSTVFVKMNMSVDVDWVTTYDTIILLKKEKINKITHKRSTKYITKQIKKQK